MIKNFIPKKTMKNINIVDSHLISESFKVYTKCDDIIDPKLDPFIISTESGFLPKMDPLLELPKKYEIIDILLKKMRWNQPDGSKGLLAKKQFGEAVLNELSEFEVEDVEDKMVAHALFRDYSFLTSAYLLEECHHNYLKTGNYGLGREILPKVIARPFYKLADKLHLRPFMEYNTCYANFNYFRKDPSLGLSINNLDIHRSFINMKSETGFILVHVAINQHGGNLIKAGMNVLKACELKDRNMFNDALIEMRETLSFMNGEFERMYYESNPSDYNIFRTFIMGIANQPMFPNGVVYEGCYDNKPQFFRGESGANDSIIPFCDNILEITKLMPKNPLTDILRDFRTYRPKSHKDFLKFTEETANELGVMEFAKKDPESMIYFLEVADQNRAFRHRHWVLTNMYILNFSKHPTATGGSPIVTWLPNQLLTVIDFIKTHANTLQTTGKALPNYLEYSLKAIVRRCDADERIIRREVETKKSKYNY